MKRIILMTERDSDDVSAEAAELQSRFGEKDWRVEVWKYSDLCYELTDHMAIYNVDTNVGLDDAQFVYFSRWHAVREEAFVCAHFMQKQGIPFSDAEIIEQAPLGKLSQYFVLRANNLPIPYSIFCPNASHLSRAVKRSLSYPCVIKDIYSDRGENNYLVRNLQQLEGLREKSKDKNLKFVAQSYIQNAGDYRVLVMGDKIPLVIHRQRATDDTHLNNVSQGAVATIVNVKTLPQQLRDDAIRAAKIFRRDVAGVDIIQEVGTGKHFFLEVNSGPQIASGAHVKDKMDAFYNYITNRLSL